jgi:hypothetical protein
VLHLDHGDTPELARECIELATSKFGFHQFNVVGCVPVPGEDNCVAQSSLLPMGESLLVMARRYEASEIVVTVTNRRGSAFPIRQLLECALGGVKVIDAATFFEREACQIRLDSLQPSYLIFGGGFDQSFAAPAPRIRLVASGWSPGHLAGHAATAAIAEDGARCSIAGRVGGRPHSRCSSSAACKDAEQGGPDMGHADDRASPASATLRTLRIDELRRCSTYSRAR